MCKKNVQMVPKRTPIPDPMRLKTLPTTLPATLFCLFSKEWNWQQSMESSKEIKSNVFCFFFSGGYKERDGYRMPCLESEKYFFWIMNSARLLYRDKGWRINIQWCGLALCHKSLQAWNLKVPLISLAANQAKLRRSGLNTMAALEKENDALPFIDSYNDLACDLGLILAQEYKSHLKTSHKRYCSYIFSVLCSILLKDACKFTPSFLDFNTSFFNSFWTKSRPVLGNFLFLFFFGGGIVTCCFNVYWKWQRLYHSMNKITTFQASKYLALQIWTKYSNFMNYSQSI